MTTPDPISSADEDDHLGSRVRSGLAWSVSQQLILRIASFLSGIALARILAPDDFGVFTVAMAAMTVLIATNDLGVILGVVRWPGDHRQVAPTATTIALTSSSLLAVGCILLAGPFTELMGSPESAGILRLLSLTLVLDGIVAVPTALLLRDFRQDQLAKAELTAVPVGIGLAIGLALAGAGPWALALSRLGGAAMTMTMVLFRTPERPWPGWDTSVSRRLLGFGLPVAGTTLVEEVLLNIDYFIVGAVLGPEALGLYLLAFNIANWPISMMKQGIRRVSIVGFSKLADDPDELSRGFIRSFGLLFSIALPLTLALSILAEPLIEVVYGPTWTVSATALEFLAFLGLARLMTGFVFDLLIGMGRSRTTLGLQLAWLAVLAPSLWIVTSAVRTIAAPAATHAAVAFVVVIPLFLWALRTAGVGLRAVATTARRPLVGGLAAALFMLLAREWLENDFAVLLVGGVGAAMLYAAIALRGELGQWREWRTARRRSVAHEGTT